MFVHPLTSEILTLYAPAIDTIMSFVICPPGFHKYPVAREELSVVDSPLHKTESAVVTVGLAGNPKTLILSGLAIPVMAMFVETTRTW